SFADPSPAPRSTLSLHDALPIFHEPLDRLVRVEALGHGAELRTDAGEIGDRYAGLAAPGTVGIGGPEVLPLAVQPVGLVGTEVLDRKSTRLNSSHVKISYAVFCL